MRRSALVLPVEDGDPVGAEALEDLGLGGRDLVHGLEELEVHGGHHGDDGHVRPRDRGQLAQLARRGHPQLQHRVAVLGGEAQQREGQPVLVVEVPLRLQDRAPRGEERGRHLLGRGLARGAGDGNHGDGRPRPHVAAEVLEGLRRVPHRDHRHARRQLDVAVDHRAPRAPLRRLGDEVVAVEARPRHGHEELAGGEGARVDGHARERRPRVAGHAAGRPRGHVFEGQGARLLAHGSPPHHLAGREARRDRTSRATCRSSKGTVRSRSTW